MKAAPGSTHGRWSSSPRFWLCAGAVLALHGAATGLVWAGAGARPSVVVKSMAVRTLSWVSEEGLSGASPPAPFLVPDASLPALSGTPESLDSPRREVVGGPAIASGSVMSSVAPPASAPAVAGTTATLLARPPDATPERQAGLPPAPDYMKSAGLEVGPRPLGEIEPEYPESANLQEGSVTVRVLISEAGRVDNVAVVRSEPKGLFEQAALEAFSKARFEPARYAGLPVKSQLTVEVHFLPINRGARISGRGY